MQSSLCFEFSSQNRPRQEIDFVWRQYTVSLDNRWTGSYSLAMRLKDVKARLFEIVSLFPVTMQTLKILLHL